MSKSSQWHVKILFYFSYNYEKRENYQMYIKIKIHKIKLVSRKIVALLFK